jgi:Zn-dependent M28 family amino/carboxypeptidase
MKINHINILAYLLSLLLLLSCNFQSKKKPEDSNNKKEEVKIKIPQFNKDSAFRYVAEQVAFGPRVPNTKAHKECAAYLEDKMKTFTPDVFVQSFKERAFDGTVLNGYNIISQFNKSARKRVLLGAHWDSRPFADHDPDEANHRKHIDGANDGASGIGVLIELARLLSQQPSQVGVDIVFFDLEDYGIPSFENRYDNESWAIGSRYWSNNPIPPDYRATYGILLDMVGAKDAVFHMEGHSMIYASHIVKKVWKKAAELGYGHMFLFEDGGMIMDDHIPVNRIMKIPMIDIIHFDSTTETNFFPHWHTVSDNLDNIDPYTLGVVGEVVTHVIYNE